ncbi:hypothetical protein P4475_09655 [Halalkalibacterium halodurans]|uniref:hypothetical protein n=1 Tax=Halalkalibacterium halodurans TaxID=86665 RepID=UPI001068B340|nr:hypothetical protein [Halalkalibacterium halodurans]MED3647070.1 hypothetical protein [Halalkalibacterium halodurans]TES53921.1 hypothetical protein E2L07_11435 [Halalkalibacterium halodurans]
MKETKHVYILLTDTGTLFTRMINHASIAFDRELSELYSFGRKRPHNPFLGGFVRENVHAPLFYRASCAVYRCEVSLADYKAMKQKVAMIEKQQDDYRYNLLGLIGLMCKWDIQRERAFFCSQFVATILNGGSTKLVSTPPQFVQPYHLTDLICTEKIYEGKLAAYPFLIWGETSEGMSVAKCEQYAG